MQKDGELIDIGVDLGIIEKSGSWLSYAGQKIGQGRDNAKQYFTENPQILAEIEAKIRAQNNAPVITKPVINATPFVEAMA